MRLPLINEADRLDRNRSNHCLPRSSGTLPCTTRRRDPGTRSSSSRYLSADHACYAFQTPEYSKHFTCVAVDLRGTGTTDKPAGPYSTEQSADDVASLMDVLDIDRAHIAGVSFGAATGMWLAAKYPERVASLSLHSAWAKTDPFIAAVVKGWQAMAQALGSVADW